MPHSGTIRLVRCVGVGILVVDFDIFWGKNVARHTKNWDTVSDGEKELNYLIYDE